MTADVWAISPYEFLSRRHVHMHVMKLKITANQCFDFTNDFKITCKIIA